MDYKIGDDLQVTLQIKQIIQDKNGTSYVLVVPGKPSTFNNITVESEVVDADIQS